MPSTIEENCLKYARRCGRLAGVIQTAIEDLESNTADEQRVRWALKTLRDGWALYEAGRR